MLETLLDAGRRVRARVVAFIEEHMIADAGPVLKKAWSVRLMAGALVFQLAEVVLPIFQSLIPDGLFTGLSAGATLGALYFRFFAQDNLRGEQ